MSPKPTRIIVLSFLLLCGLLLAAFAQAPNATTQAAAGASPRQQTVEPPPASSERALIVLGWYNTDVDPIKPGSNFNLNLFLTNSGQNPASNITVTFTPGDLVPRETGGVVSLYQLNPSDFRRQPGDSEAGKVLTQPLTASSALTAGSLISVPISVSYTDMNTAASYSATFSLTFTVGAAGSGSSGPARPTATPTAIPRPQLVISNYSTDVAILQPGTPFSLKLEVRNLGNANARGVTMVLGGGSTAPSGTQESGGISGTGGDFSVFAPLKSSNIQFIGDVKTAEAIQLQQDLIVNVTANPGAYSAKISFVYVDERGMRFLDDQVITLLVYSLPLVDVDFYQQAGPFMVGQPSPLPLQIINLSRKSTILGNMTVKVPEGNEIQNATVLIGALEPGGYFPLDAMLIPGLPGPLELTISVNYTDDFNQLRTITETLTLNVDEAPIIEPPMDGIPGEGMPMEPVMPVDESFWQKVGRFFKGLVGLNSAVPQPALIEMPVDMGEMSPGEIPPSEGKPIIVPAPAKGG
jgi:hypothetical protein